MPSVTASIVTLLAECIEWSRRGDARGAVRPGICWWLDKRLSCAGARMCVKGVLFVTTAGSAPVSNTVLVTETPGSS
jgi:hypothetical protein